MHRATVSPEVMRHNSSRPGRTNVQKNTRENVNVETPAGYNDSFVRVETWQSRAATQFSLLKFLEFNSKN